MQQLRLIIGDLPALQGWYRWRRLERPEGAARTAKLFETRVLEQCLEMHACCPGDHSHDSAKTWGQGGWQQKDDSWDDGWQSQEWSQEKAGR